MIAGVSRDAAAELSWRGDLQDEDKDTPRRRGPTEQAIVTCRSSDVMAVESVAMMST